MRLLVWTLLLLCSQTAVSGRNITVPVIWDLFFPPNSWGLSIFEWAIADMKQQGALPDLDVKFDYTFTASQVVLSVDSLLEYAQQGNSLVIGNFFSNIITSTGIVGSVYNVAQISPTATAFELSDKSLYPYVSRLVPSNVAQIGALISFLNYYQSNYPSYGWDRISILLTADALGVSLYHQFTQQLPEQFQVRSTQAFLPDQTDLTVELETVKASGGRVIVCLMSDGILPTVVSQALDLGLISSEFQWLVNDLFVSIPFYLDLNTGTVDQRLAEALRGFIGTNIHVANQGPYAALAQHYAESVSPVIGPPSSTAVLTYDLGLMLGLVLDTAQQLGLLEQAYIEPQVWTELFRNTSFQGSSGYVQLDQNGDRITDYDIVNFIPEQLGTNFGWVPVALWHSQTDDLEFSQAVLWPSNTTQVPDLDIRPPVRYWSCDHGELRWDPTGKTVPIQTPDGSQPNAIDSGYYCDGFIDCHNLSDESNHCSTNYTVVFIVFGIVTGLLMLLSLLLIPFVLVFGVCIRRKRVSAASPVFLMVLILSAFVGFASTFAWYGKPHRVACGFQPWLLGLSVVSMIAALSAKTFRIWRIFKSPFSRVVITDLELMVLWVVIVVPAVVILAVWTLVSTPTAAMEERGDAQHYVCTTGGFTGYPGGYVFFAVFVGYLVGVLAWALFLSVVTRNVPSLFNESKLVAISIYNIALLGMVIIPTVLVLQQFEPFIAWIIRTVAILYGFSATLWLQFVPKIVGLVIFDRCGDTNMNRSSMKWMSTHSPLPLGKISIES